MPEETLCQEVVGVTHHQNKCNDGSSSVSGKSADVVNSYLLEHVKYDFYKKGSDQLTVMVYVKEIDEKSLQVNFQVQALCLRFKTKSQEFLKLHKVSKDTVFEWTVHLRHQIDCTNCKYAVTKSKLAMTLKKASVKDQWNSLEELNKKGAGDEGLKNGPKHLNNMNGDHVTERGNMKTGDTGQLNRSTGSLVLERGNIKPGDTGHLSSTGGPVAERNNIKTGDSGHLSSTGSPVAEKDSIKFKTETGAVSLEHCNGNSANFSNENNVRLDVEEVFVSQTPDDTEDLKNMSNGKSESTRTEHQIGDSNNHKSCEVNETTDGSGYNSEYALCNGMKITGNGLSDRCTCASMGKDVACTCHTLEQHNNKNSTSTIQNISNITNPCDKSNDTTKCSFLPSENKVSVYEDSPDKDNLFEENKGFKLSYDAKKHVCRPGSAGLVNLANLCYINSVVQCLSSVIELRTYLLSMKYSSHINRDNKNGYQGQLISAFDSVMQQLWSGKERNVSASKLKCVLGKKKKQFMYYGQEDAQEFFTFLLDGLHEDLKEERKKALSLRESKTDDSKDVLKSSQVDWEKHCNGNTSIISNLFQGQSVSNICCKECLKPSTSFDHWMQLNLSIPEDPLYLHVHVFFLDPEKKPLKTKMKVHQRAHCSDLITQLSRIVNIPAHCLLLLRSRYNRISHIYDPIDEISLSSESDVLIACEILVPKQDISSSNTEVESTCSELCESNGKGNIEKQCSYDIVHISVIQRLTHRVTGKCNHCGLENPALLYCSKCCRVAYCNRECQRGNWKNHRPYCEFHPLIIGTPFIISIDASKATLDNLQKKALSYARYSVAPVKGQLEAGKFHLTLLENLTDFHSKGIKLKDEGIPDENVCLALDWDATTQDSKVISKELICDIHDSVNETHSSEDKSCSLEECLKLYWNPENINKESGWRCDHCKDVRAATRKMMICKHPENLVLHLKRFSYTRNGRKICKHIQFPLRGLDMSPFTHPQMPKNDAIYDLHAVCSHYGYMNYGHYIAFCQPYSEEELETMALTHTDGWLRYDDNKVNNAKESEVEGTCAYILFYRRREKASSCIKQTVEDDTSTAGHFDPQEESGETSEAATEQNTMLKNNRNADILLNERESSGSSNSTDRETLLEDVLD